MRRGTKRMTMKIERWRASTHGRQVTRTGVAKQRLRVRHYGAADLMVSSARVTDGFTTEADEIRLGFAADEAAPADGIYWAPLMETFRLPTHARAVLVELISQVFPGAEMRIRHRSQAEREPAEYASVAIYVRDMPADEVLDREEDLAARFEEAHPELADRVVTRAMYR